MHNFIFGALWLPTIGDYANTLSTCTSRIAILGAVHWLMQMTNVQD